MRVHACVCVHVCVGGSWGRAQMCHRSCMLGGCGGPCESEHVDWAPASRPWAERVAACVETPHRSSQHWGTVEGTASVFCLEKQPGRSELSQPRCVWSSPCSRSSCSCSSSLLPVLSAVSLVLPLSRIPRLPAFLRELVWVGF